MSLSAHATTNAGERLPSPPRALQAGLRQRGKDQQLGGEPGTEKDLDQRAEPFDR